MKILRTIETFNPNYSEPAQQAWQISHRLEKIGIRSPILTAGDPSDSSLSREIWGGVQVTRVPVQGTIGGYRISFGMVPYLRNYHILHSHLYRTFQTDCAFFLPPCEKNRLC